jgi:hypothetical protein
MPRHPSRLLELAKRGAEIQFQDLLHEAEMLIDLFPHLRDSFDTDELPLTFLMAEGSGAAAKASERRKRRRKSAAARKKVGDARRKR